MYVTVRLINESGQPVSIYIDDDYVGQFGTFGDSQPILLPAKCRLTIVKGGQVVWGPKSVEADQTIVIR